MHVCVCICVAVVGKKKRGLPEVDQFCYVSLALVEEVVGIEHLRHIVAGEGGELGGQVVKSVLAEVASGGTLKSERT